MNKDVFKQREPMAAWIRWLPMAVYAVLVILRAYLDPYREDEEYTWWLIREPWGEFVFEIFSDVHPPLYYLLLMPLARVFDHPFLIKIYSMAFGALCLWMAMHIVRRDWGDRPAWMAGWLWATLPLFVHTSQDGRMYTMALAMELLIAILLLRPRPQTWRNGIAMTLLLTASWYTHMFCTFFALALYVQFFVWNSWLWSRGESTTAHWCGLLAWQFATGAAALALYLPWIPVILNQADSTRVLTSFGAPSWNDIYYFFVLYPYSLNRIPSWLVVLFALPVLYGLALFAMMLRSKSQTAVSSNGPRIPPWFWLSLGFVPLAAVTLISVYLKPMVALSRHTVLFLPFILLAGGVGLAGLKRGWQAAICLCALTVAVWTLGLPTEYNPRKAVKAVNEYAGEELPVLFYPFIKPEFELEWRSANLPDIESPDDIPDSMTDYILVVRSYESSGRSELLDRVRMAFTEAQSVETIHDEYDVIAYHVRGMPASHTRGFLGLTPYIGYRTTQERLGNWAPLVEYENESLRAIVRPEGELLSLNFVNPDWLGLRLTARESVVDFGEALSDSPGMAAVIVYGRPVMQDWAVKIPLQLGGHELMAPWWGQGDNIVAGLVDARNTPPEFTISIPEHLVERRHAPAGDFMPGVYLTWAAVVPLDPAKMHDGEATFIDIGALGDDLFLRGGQHEREGVTPNFVRWMEPEFSVEVPVFEEGVQRVQISGILPAKIENRIVTVTVAGGGVDGQDVTGQVSIPNGDWNSFNLDLSAPLAPGPQLLQFEIGGVYIPKAHGDGEDPRELGFLLDQIRLLKMQ